MHARSHDSGVKPDGAGAFNPPLRVARFIATRRGDAERGPLIRINAAEAKIRSVQDGELVRVETPRRPELATLQVDDGVGRGEAVIRDVAGVSPSEIVRVRKLDLDTPERRLG
jgi:anaerobic selenocysteine-containing dehydrogenase